MEKIRNRFIVVTRAWNADVPIHVYKGNDRSSAMKSAAFWDERGHTEAYEYDRDGTQSLLAENGPSGAYEYED